MDGLSFVINDKVDGFGRHVVAHRNAEATLVWNDVPRAFFVLDDDDPALVDILANGARCAVLFNGLEEFRGRVSATPGAGPEGHVTVYVEGDFCRLRDLPAWPKPTSALSSQTDEYARYSGPSETVVKAAVAANVGRLAGSWVVNSSSGRGADVAVEVRMNPLGDKVLPLLKVDRLGLTITYPGGTPTVDVRSPETVGGVLDLSSGRIDTFDFSRLAPTATRATVGGPGEGTARTFVQVVDFDLENEWGIVLEIFVDARSADTTDDMEAAGWAALAEGAPKTSVSMEITEQPGFTYHQTYELGDIVPVKIGDIEATEVITSITIKDTPDQGVTVTPVIGDVVRDEIARLSNQLARLQARTRTLGRR